MTTRADAELTAMLQLDSARVVIGAVLEGHWYPDPALMGALAELVEVATHRLAELERAA